MKIIPLLSNIVLRLEKEEKQGEFVVSGGKERKNVARVVELGSNVEVGGFMIGDRVVFNTASNCEEIEYKNGKLLVINSKDIMGVIKENKNAETN